MKRKHYLKPAIHIAKLQHAYLLSGSAAETAVSANRGGYVQDDTYTDTDWE